MNILLTGKNGFVGKNLLRNKSFLSHNINSIDREHFQTPKYIEDIFKAKPFDYLIHLASSMTPNKDNAHISNDIENDIFNAIKLFDLAVKYRTKCIVFISSAGALGSFEANNVSIKSVYGLAKFFLENFLRLHSQNSDTKILNLRVSNLYGPEQIFKNNQGVIPNFYHHMCHDNTIDVWGSGDNKKDYLFIHDFIELINHILKKGPSSGSFDVGSGNQHSINEIINIFSNALKKKPTVNYLNPLASDHSNIDVDISAVSNEFNWKPSISLQEGIGIYIEWAKSHEK